MDDNKILTLLYQNPDAGCDAVLQKYGALINGILRKFLNQHSQDVEECAADILVAAWKNAEKLQQSQKPLRAWLIVTARNAAIDRLRQNGRRAEILFDENLALEVPETDNSEVEEMLQLLVSKMEQPDREIFLRRYWLGQYSKEIGAALKMDANAINSRLYRGRQQLRTKIMNEMGLEWEVSYHG